MFIVVFIVDAPTVVSCCFVFRVFVSFSSILWVIERRERKKCLNDTYCDSFAVEESACIPCPFLLRPWDKQIFLFFFLKIAIAPRTLPWQSYNVNFLLFFFFLFSPRRNYASFTQKINRYGFWMLHMLSAVIHIKNVNVKILKVF